MSDGTGWFVFANYEQGRKTMPLFASLDAFYPGLLVSSIDRLDLSVHRNTMIFV